METPEREEVLAAVEASVRAGEAPEAWAGRLRALQPFDVAELLSRLPEDGRLAVLAALPPDVAAESLEHLTPEVQYRILDRLGPDGSLTLLLHMSSDAVADLLLSLHPNQAARLREALPLGYREELERLMTFPEHTAGSLASVDYVAAREHWTVDEALAHVRKVAREAETLNYVYVLDARGRLVGVVSLRELLLASGGDRLGAIARRDVISVRATTDQEEAARILARYDFVALPVVGDDGRMVGIVTVDDLVDVIHEEAMEDIQRLGGSLPLRESYFRTPVLGLFRRRVGWLLVLFVAESYTSAVLAHFQTTLAQVVALSFFIPLLTGTGGNIGSQTVATLVRSLAVGEVGFRDILRVAAKEALTGVLLGAAMAVAAYVRAAMMGVGFPVGSVVATGALFIGLWASIVAAVLPIALHRLRVDPAVVSGPLITTLVDGTGLFIYFSLARLMLGV